ncbi:MAG: long-chain-acyl-CoA synthetase [Hyphomicrobiaceae bacterium]|nr:long-chain-acyl-CoA synthetase [Hyphomicrobiaceae bacterium]
MFFDRIASEIAYLRGALRTLSRLKPIMLARERTWSDVAEQLAEKYGDRDMALSAHGDEKHSFRSYNARANQYARWAIANGVEKGDTVALMMPNRPEYLAVWLGIARAGGVTALLNTNLTGHPLAHCVNIVTPKHVICDARLAGAMASALGEIAEGPTFWVYGESESGWPRIDTLLDGIDDGPLPANQRPKLTIEDKCLYIYTSGTTGLPKAANINHYRVQSVMNGFSAATNASDADRIYICLPLYHTAGGVLAVGTVITVGGTVVIGEKFSAQSFWDHVVDNNCTMFQYIGELCRYLLNSPAHPKETQHRLRIISGNGLRPDIWVDFKERFRIPKILEWYAATEGNAVFLNFDGKVGAVGRIPKWAEKKFVTEVVRFDHETEQPVRGPNGFCIKATPNEIGETISQILNDPDRPSQRFEGYADKAATEKKILRDVFEKGDAWFRSGDLMRRDELGYFYFVDRIGDTFRWKGENVATSEVSETLSSYPGLEEINVYGVAVEGRDGRAGMAALVVKDSFDLDGFSVFVKERLPDYERPLFLRIQPQMEITGTFKIRKVDLVKDGFDPSRIRDTLYFFDPREGQYVPLDSALYAEIQGGGIRL